VCLHSGSASLIGVSLQNRVSPRGEIVAASERGTLMGNRGVLHDPAQRIIRPWQLIRWIACVTEFRGRRRPLMAPGRWTELFFLDEATAFAAGHRPCAHCRHADYQRFRRAWSAGRGLEPASAAAIDRVLHEERLIGRREQRTHVARRCALPDGAMVSLDGEAHLVRGDALLPWSFAGYGAPRAGPLPARVEVLTPRSTVEALRGGYVADLHSSAARGQDSGSG
jgi:hypothetical protein